MISENISKLAEKDLQNMREIKIRKCYHLESFLNFYGNSTSS